MVSSVALTVWLGLQSLRALLPQMSFLLRDRLGWSAPQIACLGLAMFGAGFLVAALHRLLGRERQLLWVGLGLPALRLASQLFRGDPIGDLILAMLSMTAFLLLVPALLVVIRSLRQPIGNLALGWLLGQLGDLALFGLTGTWDLAWRSGWLPVAVVTGLCAWHAVSILLLGKACRRESSPENDLAGAAAWAWTGFGPLLFLVITQASNPGRYAAQMADSHRVTWLVIAAAQASALVLLTSGLRRGGSPGPLLLAPALAALVGVHWQSGWPDGTVVIQAFLATLLTMLLWGLILLAAEAGAASPGLGRLTWAHGVSTLLFGALLLFRGASYDVPLPFSSDLLTPTSAILLAISALLAAAVLRAHEPTPQRGWRPWLAVALALAAPSAVMVGTAEKSSRMIEPRRPGAALRVMTYNLHCGVSPRGALDLEAFAATLEAEKPDIVVLQEVSRGWTVNGTVDIPEWLARRLGMDFVFAGTAGPLWGNAVLTRLPVLSWRSAPLPSPGLVLRRGVLEVSLALGNGRSFRVLATHLHHPDDGGAVRELQSQELLRLWGAQPRTAIAGDLNATPTAPELTRLRQAGLVDAFARAGLGEGATFSAWRPHKRIDYIWLSPDLRVTSARVPRSQASDHLPVVADIELRP